MRAELRDFSFFGAGLVQKFCGIVGLDNHKTIDVRDVAK